MAVDTRAPRAVVLHSDRGCQYTARIRPASRPLATGADQPGGLLTICQGQKSSKRGSYSQWTWRDFTRGKTRVIPKMALEALPHFPWRSACCQAPAARGDAAPSPEPPPTAQQAVCTERGFPRLQGESQGRLPPVAKPARKLFQAKVRLQTASPHAPDRRAFRLPTWHRPQRAAEQRRTARHGRGCGLSVAACRTWRATTGHAGGD